MGSGVCAAGGGLQDPPPCTQAPGRLKGASLPLRGLLIWALSHPGAAAAEPGRVHLCDTPLRHAAVPARWDSWTRTVGQPDQDGGTAAPGSLPPGAADMLLGSALWRSCK